MRAILVMFDSLNREFLPNYGCDWTKMPNFKRLGEKTTVFDNFYGGSMPCMPARRELHTGRYNFLHCFWTPMHPYDDSVISRMRKANIYTHISTDHFHYWEDGGAGYLTKYDSFEMIRGQQGDHWKGQVQWPDYPETLSHRNRTENWRHDWINRSFLDSEVKMPQTCTFANGLDFIDRNIGEDNWFLQIEAFDPHEPFYTQKEYKDLYPHDYHGKNLDWPDYGKNSYGDAATEHVRYEYAALMSMCDNYLGKVLDMMDAHDMWKDTMLIVNTDHGFMLGEKEWFGKNVQPFYNELVHLPFFIHDPRNPHPGERRKALAQTVDIVPTLAEYFRIDPPEHMDGVSLTPAIAEDLPVREYALFGIHGGHVNITDGRYVYMHAPVRPDGKPLYEYTLMPMHMNAPFEAEELRNITVTDEFSFTRGACVMKVPARAIFNAYWYGTMLFDLEKDPRQTDPIDDAAVQLRLLENMRAMMKKNEAPQEQYERLGIPMEGGIEESILGKYRNQEHAHITDVEGFAGKAERAAAIYISGCDDKKAECFKQKLREQALSGPLTLEVVMDLIKSELPPQVAPRFMQMINNYL